MDSLSKIFTVIFSAYTLLNFIENKHRCRWFSYLSQHWVYCQPSASLRRPPSWWRGVVESAFRSGASSCCCCSGEEVSVVVEWERERVSEKMDVIEFQSRDCCWRSICSCWCCLSTEIGWEWGGQSIEPAVAVCMLIFYVAQSDI